jgi:hypothetical protein
LERAHCALWNPIPLLVGYGSGDRRSIDLCPQNARSERLEKKQEKAGTATEKLHHFI